MARAGPARTPFRSTKKQSRAKDSNGQGGGDDHRADNHCLEQGPSADPENWQVVHTYLLAEAGVPILEIANLEELAQDKVFEFAFFGACIRLRGATGAPMRAAMLPC